MRYRFLILLATTMLLGCGPNITAIIDSGSVRESVYENGELRFVFTKPVDWTWAPENELRQMGIIGSEVLYADDAQKKSEIAKAMQRTAYLFMAKGAGGENIIGLAEALPLGHGGMSAKEYNTESFKHLASAAIPYKKTGHKTASIDNVSFNVMLLTGDYQGVAVKQCYYTTIRKGCAVCFIGSYLNDTQQAQIEKLIEATQLR